ncbi:hypothetical protein SteCoe_19212 [Stentor coeruleus]|uniref:Uncharacterized protein n=1 Tax=Stentor coeruleus TaxID=5963 RepID=A0A1R2BUT2_9CILI|nr:hypothetical protein SteCoe_19212 [Stentor coeruleus]
MYRGLNESDCLINKIVDEMKSEYLKSINSELATNGDLMIAYPDLTVFYYNRDRQNALSEIKRIWDKVQSTHLGTKSLNDFLLTLATILEENHIKYMNKLKIAKNLKKYLISTQEVLNSMVFDHNSINNTESEVLLNYSSISATNDPNQDMIINLEFQVNFIEITDLRRAFIEGFAGYSVEILSKDYRFMTKIVDIDGNKAIWNFKTKLKLRYSEKTVKISLFEHSTKTSSSIKIAEFHMDLFNYLLDSQNTDKNCKIRPCKMEKYKFVIESKEKYAIMDIVDRNIDDVPKIAFTIKIGLKNCEAFKDLVNERIRYLSNQLLRIKKGIERINTKLVQQISGFQNLGFDETRIFIVSEQKRSFSCFSGCGKNGNKKNCQVF